MLDALPDLTRLNVNGCISLSRLVLKTCAKLEWLDCSGCAHMHHINTFSPALSHLTAVACQRLVVSLLSASCECLWCDYSCLSLLLCSPPKAARQPNPMFKNYISLLLLLLQMVHLAAVPTHFSAHDSRFCAEVAPHMPGGTLTLASNWRCCCRKSSMAGCF